MTLRHQIRFWQWSPFIAQERGLCGLRRVVKPSCVGSLLSAADTQRADLVYLAGSPEQFQSGRDFSQPDSTGIGDFGLFAHLLAVAGGCGGRRGTGGGFNHRSGPPA
jgi:hypothetical protein